MRLRQPGGGHDNNRTAVSHPERRQRARGTTDAEPDRRFLVAMIVGTYREMPGLCLHVNQAARLFGLRRSTCEIVLEDLVQQGLLRRAADGQYTSR